MRTPLLACAVIVLAATLDATAQPDRQVREPAQVSGYFLTTDGMPVSDGTATLTSAGPDHSATVTHLDPKGHFQFDRTASGTYVLRVSVPGFMIETLKVTVDPASTLVIPPRRLAAESYVRVRLRTPSGEPLTGARVVRQSFDSRGVPIAEQLPPPPAEVSDADGTVVMGPLARGIAVFGIDAAPLARMRLPDSRITGDSRLADAGTVTVEPGSVLEVRLVDEAGRPVADHDVVLEDGKPPLAWGASAQTDAEGLARFDRLASGEYTVSTQAAHRCARGIPVLERPVTIGSGATVQLRMVIGGRPWTLLLSSAGTPMPDVAVAVGPERPLAESNRTLRGRSQSFENRRLEIPVEGPCTAVTDAEGRATISDVPPGLARVAVHLSNSTWSRRIEVPLRGDEIALQVPTGVMSIRLVSADSHGAPTVPNADVVWTSGGGRISALASPTGDVLLDAVSDGPGTLRVRAAGYRPAVLALPAPPEMPYEISLRRQPEASVQCRIVTETGDVLAGAVVELMPADRIEIGEVAMTDATGRVRFSNVPEGTARLVTNAEGFAPATADVAVPPASADTVTTLVVRRREPMSVQPSMRGR